MSSIHEEVSLRSAAAELRPTQYHRLQTSLFELVFSSNSTVVGQIRSSWNTLLPYLAELALAAEQKAEGLEEAVRSAVTVSTR